MDKLYSFNFDSRTWSMRHCKRLLPSWTFGHAVRRKRSIFAYGSVQGDFGTLEVHYLFEHLDRRLQRMQQSQPTADSSLMHSDCECGISASGSTQIHLGIF